MTHRPKGSMCMSCERRLVRCDHLPFREMPVLRTDGTDFVVRCTYYAREKQEDRTR